jgi:hypothetical protein
MVNLVTFISAIITSQCHETFLNLIVFQCQVKRNGGRPKKQTPTDQPEAAQFSPHRRS